MISGHLGCFHVLIIVKNAAMTMGVLSALLGISSQVELLDHKVLRFLSACDGENVHILRGGQFGLYMVQPELRVNQGCIVQPSQLI